MSDSKQFLDKVKLLIQVGDTTALDNLLSKNKITSAQHFSNLSSSLDKKMNFNLAHHFCKSGDIDTLLYFRSKLPTFSLGFVDDSGQNCLHYAVARNNYRFVKHLLNSDQDFKGININQQTTEGGESPIFFALAKIKTSQSDRVNMVKLLLSREQLDIGLLNNNSRTCYEAHQEQFGFDEAATIVEKKYLETYQEESDQQQLQGRSSGLSQFPHDLISRLKDKKIPEKDRVKLLEDHVFQGIDLNQKEELRRRVEESKGLQQRLKDMQVQQIYDPYRFIDQEQLRKDLLKKMMEFSGITLIHNIQNIYK